MAAVSWKSAVSGNWTTAVDWSTGAVPGSADAVTIGVAGSYSIAVTSAIAADSIALTDSGAALAVTASGLTDTVTAGFSTNGAVDVDTSGTGGSSLKIGGTLTNQGSFDIGNTGLTAATTVTAGAVANSYLIELTSGTAAASLKVAGAFGNSDYVEVDYGGAGGSNLTIGGTLTNSGYFYIGSTSLTKATTVKAAALASTGAIYMNEGTAATATLDITGAAPATLSGTYQLSGDAVLEFASGGVTAIGSGANVTLNGPKAVVALSSAPTTDSALTGLASNAGFLVLEDAPALTTNVGLDNTYYLYVDNSGGGGSNLTIGGTLTNSGTLDIGNTSLAVATTVNAAALSNYDLIEVISGTAAASLKVTGAFGNSDYVEVDYSGTGGSSLTIGGTLTNSGYFYIGSTSLAKATTVKAAALASTGAIYLNEGTAATATLDITGAAPATLSGTYQLSGDALLEFASGGVTAIGSGANVTLDGPKALVALSSGLTTNSALTGLGSNAGVLVLEGGAALATTVGLDNTYYLEVDETGSGASSLTVGGALTNEYYLYVGNTALAVATTVNAAALSNYGVIYLYSGTAAATLKVTGAFGNGPNDAVDVDTSGVGGSSLTIGGTLTNNGTLDIGNTSLAKATIVKAAALASTGTIYMNEGSIATATLDVTGAAPATLSGTYQLSGDALLEFASGGVTAIGSGANVTLNGPKAVVALSSAPTTDSALTGLASNAGVLVLEDAPALTTAVGLDNTYYLEVDETGSGGSRLTIGGTLTNADYLYVGNTSLAVATTVNAAALSNYGVIYLYSGAAGSATLKVTGAFGNGRNGAVYVDTSGSGGSSLTIGGTLTNNGTLDIGNTSLAKATTVKVGSLANNDMVNLSGGSPAKATLAVTGAAANTGSITIGSFSALNASGETYTQSLGTTAVAATGALAAAAIDVTGGVLEGAGTVTGKIVNTGGSVAGGTYTSNSPGTLTVTGTYSQSGAGILEEVLTGTAAGQHSKLAVSGAANIQGGTLNADVFFTLAAGEIFPVMTFAPGTLPGLFGAIEDGSLAGNGAFVAIGGGLTLGALYNVAAGNIELQVLTTPTTTADLWNGGSGNWNTAADWSAGVPTSDTDVTIGKTASGTVTLNTGDTIDSLTIASGNTLSFAANEALAVGANVTVQSGGALALTSGDGLEVGGTLSDAGKTTVGAGGTIELLSNPLNVTGTLTVGGKIETAGATAVRLGSGVDRLVLDPGFSFVGTVAGGGANSTLELAPGSGAGVLNALGTEFTNFGKVTVDSGATWTVDALATAVSGVTIAGSGGSNTLTLTSAGTVNLAGVSGFPTIRLASTGANTLTLTNANFTGLTGSPHSITVYDGNDGNTVNASAVTGTNQLIVHAGAGADTLTGGAGNDVFYADGKTTMTGGLGTNEFAFSAAGANTIVDFAKSATNEIAFSNAGFKLGLTGASATPTALPSGLFVSDSTGTFTSSTSPTGQHFAYGTSNGDLYYSASGTTATEHLVATLTGDPALTASHLFFIT
jgi:fibronectin-binding autotransporter adhesin